MITTRTSVHPGTAAGAGDTAAQLYAAECALHVARQSGVAAWIDAASEKLHLAVVAHVGPTTVLAA